MVVGDLHVAGISIFPDETDAVLVVDSGCCVAQTPQKSSCAASSNETPCFRRFAVTFRAFHSKRTRTFHLPSVYPSSRELTVDWPRAPSPLGGSVAIGRWRHHRDLLEGRIGRMSEWATIHPDHHKTPSSRLDRKSTRLNSSHLGISYA